MKFHKEFGAVMTFVVILFLLSLGCSSSSPTASTSTPLAIPSDKLKPDEDVLPDFVVAAVADAMPDARLIAATREEEDGEVGYEVLVENE